MAFYIVLLGPPGAGKGTQAKIISGELGLPHISSGDIFRENLKNKTALGKKAQDYMNRGELVPDDITIAMVEDRLKWDDCSKGALLDGFPRTVAQANSLKRILAKKHERINIVPYIRVPKDVLIERLTGRWTCPVCGYVYHQTFNAPKQNGICDFDGANLIQRDDDKPETVEHRIRVYTEQTQPLIEYYRRENVLAEVDGAQDIQSVSNQLLEAIKARM